MFQIRALPAITILLWLPTADAAFRADPNEACVFLSEVRLNAGTYRRVGQGLYRCDSRQLRLPLGGDNVHTLRYRAQGGPESVHQVKLTLYVNSRRQVQAARQRMLQAGRLLVEGALGVDMPEELEQTLLDGATGSWSMGQADVRLEKAQVRASSHQFHLIIR